MKRWMIADLCTFVCLTPLRADPASGKGEIGFDFGATRFDSDVTGKSGFRLALRGGYHFTRLFELEGEISDSAHYTWDQEPTGDADLRLTSILLNGVLNIPSSTGRLVPYLLAGFGSARLDFPRSGPNDTGDAWQAGAGCRFFMGPHAAFRLQVTRMREKSFDVNKDHLHYVAGFTWRLGDGA
jgi:hypothetical protein